MLQWLEIVSQITAGSTRSTRITDTLPNTACGVRLVFMCEENLTKYRQLAFKLISHAVT